MIASRQRPASLRRDDFWRVGAARSTHALPFKEWHHFIIFGDGVELLINLSVAISGIGAAPTWRVIAIARTEDFVGSVDAIDGPSANLSADGCQLQLGGGHLHIMNDGYDVQIASQDGRIRSSFTFAPCAAPLIARNQTIGGGRQLSWDMYPCSRVTGTAQIADRSFVFDEVAGYHDHNWGSFAWGDDFTWEWGVVLPDEPARHGDAVVLSSLQNRARTRATLEQLFWWHRGRNVLAVSGPELAIEARGTPPPQRGWHLPPVMSLLRGRADADVPGELVMRAQTQRGDLTVTFVTERVAQLMLPAERDPLGVVTIHECIGHAHVAATLRDGQSVAWEGRGVFELVRS